MPVKNGYLASKEITEFLVWNKLKTKIIVHSAFIDSKV